MRNGLIVLALGCAACSASGSGANVPADGPLPVWRVVLDDLDGAVLAFWGPTPDSLFAVGGTLGCDGGRALVLTHDGATWWRMPVDAPTLWWVHGFAPDDVWGVGEHGTILHFDGASWTTLSSGHDYTLFGVWGAAMDDVWAVGGCVCTGSCSVLRHFDGSTWTDVDAGLSRVLFKIWGTSAHDVYAVGEAGTILHYDGAWTPMASGTTERLITVAGRGEGDVWAVGGLGRGVILHHDGTAWRSVGPDLIGGLMGVWAIQNSDVVVSGMDGVITVGGDQGWTQAANVTTSDLHGVWADGKGTVLAGGGNLFAVEDPRRGTIVAIGAMSQNAPAVWPGD